MCICPLVVFSAFRLPTTSPYLVYEVNNCSLQALKPLLARCSLSKEIIAFSGQEARRRSKFSYIFVLEYQYSYTRCYCYVSLFALSATITLIKCMLKEILVQGC